MDIYQLDNKDTREPFDKIWLDAIGGTDIEGEWHFSGTYSISITTNTIGNIYRYKGSVSKPYTKKGKGRWKVELDVCGGEYDRMLLRVLHKSASSLIQARKMIVNAILAFEKTDRYKEELWPKILHPDHCIPILKEIKGELVWIATTWIGAYSAILGKSTWSSYEFPFDSGQFYYRNPQWETKYPRLDDGRTDWDNGKKEYKDPYYGSVEVSGYGITSGGTKGQENKDRIDKALLDFK